MALSKRSTVLALAITSALAIEIGCGQNSGKTSSQTRINHTLQGNPGTPVAKKDASGKLVSTAVDPATSAQLQKIDSDFTQEQTGAPEIKEKLNIGTYQIQSIKSFFKYDDSSPIEELRAEHSVTFPPQNGKTTSYSVQQGDATSAGTMRSDNDSLGRTLDFPFSFEVTANWQPDRTKTQNFMLMNQFDGKNLTDNVNQQDLAQPSSVLGLLAEGATTGNGDVSYTTTDEKGVQISLRLYQTGENTIRIMVSYDEEPQTDSGTKSKYRNIFLDYKLTPPAAPVAPQQTAAASAPPAGQTPATPAAAAETQGPSTESAETNK